MVQVSIIIPTYNEAGNVRLLAQGLTDSFSGIDHEIVFVDDCSPDGTAGAVRSLAGFPEKIRLIERQAKLGLSGAVYEGAGAAKGEWILVMDADLSHSPQTARLLFEKRGGAELVIASRDSAEGGKRMPISRDMLSKGAEILSRLIVRKKTADPLSGFFMIKKDLLLGTRIRARGYKILLNILHDNPGIKTMDVPYVFQGRHSGRTKLDSNEVATYLLDLARIRGLIR